MFKEQRITKKETTMTTTAIATTTAGTAVRIIIDEQANGTSTAMVWDIENEKYLYAGRKQFTSIEDLVSFITEKCKLTNIKW